MRSLVYISPAVHPIRIHRGLATCFCWVLSTVTAADSIVDARSGLWEDRNRQPHAFAVVRFDRIWSYAEAQAIATKLGARLAVLPSGDAIGKAVSLSMDPAFWQCGGPWVGSKRLQDQPWLWADGLIVDPALWASDRPGQPAGLAACAMLAGESAPAGGLFDALDCDLDPARTSSALLEWEQLVDCDFNKVPDALQIEMDPSLDTDFNGQLDACATPTADLDGNGSVDFGDVAIALLNFGVCQGCPTDLDLNGVVDFGDIAIILLNFG